MRRDCDVYQEPGPNFCPNWYRFFCADLASKCLAWDVHCFPDNRLETWNTIKSLLKSTEPNSKRRSTMYSISSIVDYTVSLSQARNKNFGAAIVGALCTYI